MTAAAQLPLFPDPRRRRAPRPIERRTHIAVSELLRRAARPEWLWMQVPNGEHRTEETGALLERMGVMPGVFDFLLIGPDGLHHWLELKRGRAPLSEARRQFRAALTAGNVPHDVARSFDDAVACLQTWSVLRPIEVQ